MGTTDKKAQGASNRNWGALAEQIAAEYYITHGYTIRERNYRRKSGEIDIIAEKGDIIAFIEVKARAGDNQDPVDAVDLRKQRKVASIADSYLSNLDIDYQYRFDIMAITGTPDSYIMEFYPDAYLAPLITSRISSALSSAGK